MMTTFQNVNGRKDKASQITPCEDPWEKMVDIF